jgi:DNA-binding NtrC family response regulator
VRLPVAAVAPQRAAPQIQTSTVEHPLRVLIVDDNEDALEMLSSLVSAWGHPVLAVGESVAALEQGRRSIPTSRCWTSDSR